MVGWNGKWVAQSQLKPKQTEDSLVIDGGKKRRMKSDKFVAFAFWEKWTTKDQMEYRFSQEMISHCVEMEISPHSSASTHKNNNNNKRTE